MRLNLVILLIVVIGQRRRDCITRVRFSSGCTRTRHSNPLIRFNFKDSSARSRPLMPLVLLIILIKRVVPSNPVWRLVSLKSLSTVRGLITFKRPLRRTFRVVFLSSLLKTRLLFRVALDSPRVLQVSRLDWAARLRRNLLPCFKLSRKPPNWRFKKLGRTWLRPN